MLPRSLTHADVRAITIATTANLATMLLAAILYFNYVLFYSYSSIMIYAYLLSEALWDTKCTLVAWI